jgi:hypothetical protein
VDERRRFEQVLYMLEQVRIRFDKDLKRLIAASAYLRPLLPRHRRHTRRRCCTLRRRRVN